jgi:hypothetical protein
VQDDVVGEYPSVSGPASLNTPKNLKGNGIVRNRNTIFYAAIAALIVLAGLVPLATQGSGSLSGSHVAFAQTGPTPTPDDPVWLAFVAARAALEEETGQDLTYVRRWEFEEFEFVDGIDSCRTLEEGEQPRQLFFGWKFLFTTLTGQVYEVRTSFNYQLIAVCDDVSQAPAEATTDTTEANPDANLPAPVTGSAVSGSFEVGGQITGLYPHTVTALTTAKMKWVKFQLHVGQDGTGLIADAHASGFKIILSAIGDKNQVMNSSYQDTYATYVAGLAQAGADAIEVWNEMNIDREWPTGQIDGANYVPLLAKAYNAIKTANPNTMVITGALAPTGAESAFPGQVVNDDNYYRQMAQAGAADYADCIGVHYNEGTTSPNASTGATQGDNYPTRYFGPMLNRAMAPFGGKQACFTELGYLSPDGYGTLPGNFAWGQNTSIAEQAQWLAEAAVQSASSGRVRLMIVFNVDFTLWGADPQAGYAIIRKDGTCPACNALAGVLQ